MRYFSMFSGIGGFELGIQNAYRSQVRRVQEDTPSSYEAGQGLLTKEGQSTSTQNGWPSERSTDRIDQGPLCVGYSEIDKYAIKVYERHFSESRNEHAHIGQRPEQKERAQRGERSSDKPRLQLHDRDRPTPLCNRNGHTNYGDATKINASELPDFELLVGGFPCQAFSVAGKRAGFNDTRGTLFFDIARILAEKRPRHLVLENVKGLLSHDSGKTFQTILGVLADLGYRVEWQVLNSKDFGVPQNRERIIIVGHLGDGCRGEVFPIISDGRKDNDRSVIGSTLTTRYAHAQREGTYIEEGRNESPKIRRLTPRECEALQGFPKDWTAQGAGDEPISDTQRYKMCGNAVTTNVIEAVMTKLLEHNNE